jgi:hypothetical protein
MLSKDELLDRRGYCIKEAHRLRREAARLDSEATACLMLARDGRSSSPATAG